MIAISTSDIHHLATLSGLTLSGDETESLRKDVEKIIEYINLLDSLDVSGAEPTYQVTDLVNVGRSDDVVAGEVSREQLLALAEESLESQIRVPKVL